MAPYKREKTAQKKGAPKFNDLPAGFTWSSYDADTGNLRLQHALKGPYTHRMLSNPARLVIGLNQACCAKGRGKVYLVYTPPQQEKMLDLKNPEHMQSYHKAVTPAHAVYIPEVWTPAYQTSFREMTPYQQLQAVLVSYGAVDPSAMVLPFSCKLWDLKPGPDNLEFPGSMQAPVVVFVTPCTYVAILSVLAQNCQLHISKRRQDNAQGHQVYKTIKPGWTQFDRWKVDGADGIVDKLGDWFRSKPDCLVVFEQLTRQVNQMFLQYNKLERKWGRDTMAIETKMKAEASARAMGKGDGKVGSQSTDNGGGV